MKPIGLLNGPAGADKFRLALYPPAEDLAFFIEHHWIVRWDLRGEEPYLSENLPHPSVHLVLEKNNSRIVGVMKRKFSCLLKDRGAVLGVKFKPGAFYPLAGTPVSRFTDRTLPISDVFGVDGTALEEAVLPLADDGRMIEIAEQAVRSRQAPGTGWER